MKNLYIYLIYANFTMDLILIFFSHSTIFWDLASPPYSHVQFCNLDIFLYGRVGADPCRHIPRGRVDRSQNICSQPDHSKLLERGQAGVRLSDGSRLTISVKTLIPRVHAHQAIDAFKKWLIS